MRVAKSLAWAVAVVMVLGMIAAEVHSQGGPHGPRGRGQGRGPGFRGGRGPDAQFSVDRNDFHFLLENREKIRRQVTNTKSGVETLTETDEPAVATRLRKHVRAMYERVENNRPIRMRDPLFVEIFRHADKIEMKFKDTPKGIRVIETSSDPYVASLIQEHAKVVSGFVKRGFEEAHRNHPLPGKALGANEAFAGCKADGKANCRAGKACCRGCQDVKGTTKKGACKECQTKSGQKQGGPHKHSASPKDIKK